MLRAKDVGDLIEVSEADALWRELGLIERARVRAAVEAAIRAGADAAVEVFDLTTNVGFAARVDASIVQTTEFYLDDWWASISRTERQALRQSILRFQRGEFGDAGFRGLVGDLARTFDADRARLIGETETTRLWALGNQQAMSEAGVAEYEWRTVEDGRVDDICAGLNGQTFPMRGSGPLPPAHPRCRCGIVPVPNPDAALQRGVDALA